MGDKTRERMTVFDEGGGKITVAFHDYDVSPETEGNRTYHYDGIQWLALIGDGGAQWRLGDAIAQCATVDVYGGNMTEVLEGIRVAYLSSASSKAEMENIREQVAGFFISGEAERLVESLDEGRHQGVPITELAKHLVETPKEGEER